MENSDYIKNINTTKNKENLILTVNFLITRVNTLYSMSKDNLDKDILNVIIGTSTDFNDFKYKYNKYIKALKSKKKYSNEIESLKKFYKNILGINTSLNPGNKIETISNKKKGTLINYNNNNIINLKASIKSNNGTVEKRSITNIKKI